MKRDVRIEVVYPHALQRIWRALTDPRAIADWLMENNFEPRLGHRFQFRTKPAPSFDGIVNCEVVTLDEPKRLAYTWRLQHRHARHLDARACRRTHASAPGALGLPGTQGFLPQPHARLRLGGESFRPCCPT